MIYFSTLSLLSLQMPVDSGTRTGLLSAAQHLTPTALAPIIPSRRRELSSSVNFWPPSGRVFICIGMATSTSFQTAKLASGLRCAPSISLPRLQRMTTLISCSLWLLRLLTERVADCEPDLFTLRVISTPLVISPPTQMQKRSRKNRTRRPNAPRSLSYSVHSVRLFRPTLTAFRPHVLTPPPPAATPPLRMMTMQKTGPLHLHPRFAARF